MIRAFKELVRYRQLVRSLVGLDLKVRYRRSVLGILWTLLNPLLLMLVLWVVFGRIVRNSEKNYAMFLLSGLMVWTFFQQAVSQSLTSIVKNRMLIQKIYVPKLVFPVSVVTSNLVNFFFFIVAYHLIVPFTNVGIQKTLPLAVPALLMIYLMSTGVALILGTLNVFFRDVSHLTTVMLRALFYMTPILYRPSTLGPKAEFLIQFNPLYYPIEAIRNAIYDGVVAPPEIWITGFGISLLVLLAGAILFTATEQKFVYYA